MAFYFYILLLLNGLTGTCSVTTVSKVSVKAGQSLSIPCHYEQQYQNHVKYLCEGYYWRDCSYAIKSYESKNLRFSISDDKDQRIFTVTMNKLNSKYTDFWCAVEIKGGSDKRQYFELSFTTGTPILTVNDQEITGFIGENVYIEFYQTTPENLKCCKLGGACVANPSGFIDGTSVIINKTNNKGFTVTMSGLKTKSSGWYLCETRGYQMPVHLTVKEKPTTTATTTTVETAVTSLENTKLSTLFDLKILIIPLSVLIAIVILALIIWFLLRHKQTKAEVPATTKVEEEVTYCDVNRKSKRSPQAEDEVTYASVVHMKQNPSQRSHDTQEADVLYSSVVTRKKPNAKISSLATTDENVMYSSVVAVKNNTTKKTGKGIEEITYSTVAEPS